TGPGDREKYHLPGGGPALVVSPLAMFDFCPQSLRMRLRSVHPGSSLEEVLDNTATPVIVPEAVPHTLAPTDAELTILRSRVDSEGVLRNLRGARDGGTHHATT